MFIGNDCFVIIGEPNGGLPRSQIPMLYKLEAKSVIKSLKGIVGSFL